MTTKVVAKTDGQQDFRVLTQAKAIYLLKTIWPQAPETEVIKAAIICNTYGLNPLLKQVSLIKFKTKDGDSWVTVLGIKASRNIALGTGHKWSYIDGPRVMTTDEQTKLFGEPDTTKIWAITRIRDEKGNEYPGYGFWTRGSTAYGEDKGNSALNMAFIRSERNALDKMAPGELPNAEVTDESFMPVENFKKAIEQGHHEAAIEADQDVEELWGSQETPNPLVIVTESRAADLKAWIDERKLTKPVIEFMQKNYQRIVPLRQLTNEQADAIGKFIKEHK